MTVVLGTSLMPKIGSQTHNIPPTTSIKDKRANSAEGRYFAPRLYNIRPAATKKP